jgi:hypothetical protein
MTNAREAIVWRCNCVKNDQKRTDKRNISENKRNRIEKIE